MATRVSFLDRSEASRLRIMWAGLTYPPGTTSWQNRVRMVATWARVALPWGERVEEVTPEISPVPTAQAMAWVA